MRQSTFCKVVACAVTEIKSHHGFILDLEVRLHNYALLCISFMDTHVCGLICCQNVAFVGIFGISIGCSTVGSVIRGLPIVGGEVDYLEVSPTTQGHNTWYRCTHVCFGTLGLQTPQSIAGLLLKFITASCLKHVGANHGQLFERCVV